MDMIDSTVKDRFVELRAQGKSFAVIAEELGVSKPTLITWSREQALQIGNLRAINDEALREKYRLTKQRELETYSHQLEAVETELNKRSLANVPTDKLYGILFKLMSEARGERKPLTLQCTQSLLEDDLITQKEWEA